MIIHKSCDNPTLTIYCICRHCLMVMCTNSCMTISLCVLVVNLDIIKGLYPPSQTLQRTKPGCESVQCWQSAGNNRFMLVLVCCRSQGLVWSRIPSVVSVKCTQPWGSVITDWICYLYARDVATFELSAQPWGLWQYSLILYFENEILKSNKESGNVIVGCCHEN